MPELGEQLEQIVNTLGYEPTKESQSRMDAKVLKEYREERIIAAQQRNAERRSVGDAGSESVLRDGAVAGERGGEGDVQGNGNEGTSLDEGGASLEAPLSPRALPLPTKQREGALSLRFRERPLFHAPASSSLRTATASHSNAYIFPAGRSPEKTCHLPGLLSQTVGIQLLPIQRMEGGEEATTPVRTSRKKRARAARKEAPNRAQTDKQPFGKQGLAIQTL